MNNLVYFWDYSGWGCDYDSFLGYWGNNLVYFWDYSSWGCDYDSFLSYWGNNLVYFLGLFWLGL